MFTYSREEGTRAGKMENQITEAVKRRRRDLAMAAQLKVARRVARSFVGRTLRVLVEREAHPEELTRASVFSWEHGQIRDAAARDSKIATGTCQVARGEADAPDIDGRVYVRGRLPPGEFARVQIVGYTDYDLIGEPAGQ